MDDVEEISHTAHVRDEKAPKVELALIELKYSKQIIVAYLPIRFRADLVCYCSKQCSVASFERWTVRIANVKVKRSVLEYIRFPFISQMRSI